jgi:glycosyltransferase involved in cell wall biosynthesis
MLNVFAKSGFGKPGNATSYMKFSLILATLGRTSELAMFLESLVSQGDINLEIIVVDQNPDDRLIPVLVPYQTLFPIIHLRSEKGLSKARNIGLQHVTGDIIAFPDDDCEYPPKLLPRAQELLNTQPNISGLTGKVVDVTGKVSLGKFDKKAGNINKFNVWRRGVSVTVFLRHKDVEGILFDEHLGAGTKMGAGEETDFLLQLLAQDKHLFYDPSIQVLHPPLPTGYPPELIRKTYSYALGIGKVLQKHPYPFWFLAKMLIRPFGGSIISLLKLNLPKAKYHWNIFTGRLVGLFA